MTEAWIAPLHAYGVRLAGKYQIHDPAVDPEDVVQETWASAYARLRAIDDDTDRKRFIAICIRNHATHAIRRRRRRPETSLNKPITTVVNGGEQRDFTLEGYLPAPGDIGAEVAATIALRDLIAQAEGGDGIVAAALLVAAFGQEYTQAALGIASGTCGSRVARFRQRKEREVC